MNTEERLEALFVEARRRDGQRPHPRFSNAGGCTRQHVYDELSVREGVWVEQEDAPVRWNAAAACGHAIGGILEDAARRLGAETQQWAGLTADGDPAVSALSAAVVGSADIVWPGEVWDLKCVGDSSWYRAKKLPDQKHVVQVNGYAHALKRNAWALIYIYLGSIGKGRSLQYLIHRGETDAEMGREIARHWARVKALADKRELPERSYGEDSFECSVCRHRLECWRLDK